jgi:serine/threonine protein kinase/Tol biopolymer transport system component
MSLTTGTRLGSYEILALIGEGGMGQVYRARDSKLNRDVALKVLPEAFVHDADRLARFKREAQVLASLNHPHIAAIYGLEEANPSTSSGQAAQFLVLELVEGETLAARLKAGPLPFAEALTVARQVAEACQAAHEKGIVHRDLKPANIAFTADDQVKVLDFGLAKALEPSASADVTNSPTISLAATRAGVILGTAAYMSPEQAKGREADKRSDVWAFGAVLYEMLTGRRPFDAEDLSTTLAAVIMKDPDWTVLPSNLPPAIRALVRRCLEKDRRQRVPDISVALFLMSDPTIGAAGGSAAPAMPESPSATWQRVLPWAVAAAAVVSLAAAIAVWAPWRTPAPLPEMRVEIITPPTTDPTSLAISPDGQKIVFSATTDRSRLWLRSLESSVVRPLAGTEEAQYPFWAPDNRSIGFFTDAKLKRIDLDGGSVQAVATANAGFGGAWSRDGVILFAPRGGDAIFRVPAVGGEPTAVTRLEAKQGSHRFPVFLPDGRHFLFYVRGSSDVRGVYLGDLDGAQPRRVLDADAAAEYTASGQLLFVRQATLLAQPFDFLRFKLTGNPIPVAEQVAASGISSRAALSAAAAGPIVYHAGSALGHRQLVWFDRSGKAVGQFGEDDTGLSNPSLSPDGRRVAVNRQSDGNTDIWLLDVGRGVLDRRFTSDGATDNRPIWSPDGSRVVFVSNRKEGRFDLYSKSVLSAESETLLLTTAENKIPCDWSPDGRYLLYRSNNPKAGYDLWVLPMEGDRKAAIPVVQTEFDELNGQFSPDGKWIAYESNESRRSEIYLQPFPGPGTRVTISTNGGTQARWRADGKELFYIGLDHRLMAARVQLDSIGKTVEVGTPVPLFVTHIIDWTAVNNHQYAVSPDGTRFLINSSSAEETTSPISVILNWRPKP